jgi:hypothetical protein
MEQCFSLTTNPHQYQHQHLPKKQPAEQSLNNNMYKYRATIAIRMVLHGYSRKVFIVLAKNRLPLVDASLQ